ncbi:MAG: hypothetical protein ACJ8ER_09085 [Allosphingosinicella sp.]
MAGKSAVLLRKLADQCRSLAAAAGTREAAAALSKMAGSYERQARRAADAEAEARAALAGPRIET